ncbi:hypothetical protein D9611_008017 [Ephemerocybe angulata]|uniref:BTB domain-containing protein n=1 Tax=Ephemerocybe angulata TaxID=980116 RepID=A0A8H5FCQ0_9AGAR|nr:hypothetical protein D9611_008017 [Tulosesus angulatus]
MSIPVSEILEPAVSREEAPLPSIGDLILRIEDVTQTVPARLTRIYAPIFAKIVDLNDPQSSEDGDMPVDHPPFPDVAIVITYCTLSEFHCFMKVLCGPKGATISLAKEEWISVFKLATLWDAHWIQGEAAREIARLGGLGSPLEIALLGKKHNVAYWYIEGLCALSNVGDSTPLDQIGEALGWETAARIASAGLATSEAQRAVVKDVALSVPNTTLACGCNKSNSLDYSIQPWRPPPGTGPKGMQVAGGVVSARRVATADWKCRSESCGFSCSRSNNLRFATRDDTFLQVDRAAIVHRCRVNNTNIIKQIFADELEDMF